MIEVALSTLTPGERGRVSRIHGGTSRARQRLMEMGLVRGTPVKVIRFAPMGDPVEVQVGPYRLSLRRVEAEAVTVEKEER